MVTLKPFMEQDFDSLIGWVDSPEFLSQWAGPAFTYPLTHEQLKQYLSQTEGEECNSLIYTVWMEEKRVGHISLNKIDRDNRSARIGKVLVGDTSEKGRGLCRKMVTEVLKVAFDELHMHRVSLGVFDFNQPAIRCYEKAGFQKEGLLRDYRKVGTTYWNLYEMSILSEEWAG